jgi:hypothetical protein
MHNTKEDEKRREERSILLNGGVERGVEGVKGCKSKQSAMLSFETRRLKPTSFLLIVRMSCLCNAIV